MDITQLPFNSFIGIKRTAQPEIGQLKLEDLPQYKNHIETVHASAQFALAEACSGEYLLKHFNESAENYLPVVRRAEVKYRKPAQGKIYANAQVSEEHQREFIEELTKRGRAKINIEVQIVDSENIQTMTAAFEWYVQMIEEKK